jgi:CDP-diacylglycerol--glycerol-3-phosphate 3-phosphatidyltransferase
LSFDAILSLLVLAVILTTAAVSIGGFARSGRDLSGVGGSAVLGPLMRSWYFENLRPFEDWCVRRGIQPAALTYAQLLLSLAVGALYAAGMYFTAGWLLLASGSFDIVDGRLARRTGTGSARGAFLDSVVDRYADSFTYIGLAIALHASSVLWVVLLCLLGGSMVSYTRARAEALGVECKVGLLQRPERTVILGLGSMLAVLVDRIGGPWWGMHDGLLVVTLVVIAVLSNFSALHRVLHVQRELRRRANG